jgi:hypothetical protein
MPVSACSRAEADFLCPPTPPRQEQDIRYRLVDEPSFDVMERRYATEGTHAFYDAARQGA